MINISRRSRTGESASREASETWACDAGMARRSASCWCISHSRELGDAVVVLLVRVHEWLGAAVLKPEPLPLRITAPPPSGNPGRA